MEALQKEGGGGDNLAVGWAKPGESSSVPSEVIPGWALAPFNETAVAPAPEIIVYGNSTACCGRRYYPECLRPHGLWKHWFPERNRDPNLHHPEYRHSDVDCRPCYPVRSERGRFQRARCNQ